MSVKASPCFLNGENVVFATIQAQTNKQRPRPVHRFHSKYILRSPSYHHAEQGEKRAHVEFQFSYADDEVGIDYLLMYLWVPDNEDEAYSFRDQLGYKVEEGGSVPAKKSMSSRQSHVFDGARLRFSVGY